MAQVATFAGRLGASFLLLVASGFEVGEASTPDTEGHLALVADSPVDPVELSPEEQELMEFGLSRFRAQRLALPEIRFDFTSDIMDCDGHMGMYHRRTSTVQMCSLDKGTMLHELAHAWANHVLSEADKQAFVELRGLDSWNDQTRAWKQRGTEHAAEVIAWALLEEPNALLFFGEGPDGSKKPEFRLLSIDNSSVESLHEAFVQLTGMEPVFRTPSDLDSVALYKDWQARMPATSPEARR